MARGVKRNLAAPVSRTTQWRVNVTQLKTGNGRAIDGTDARELSMGESEGRRQALAFFEFLKANAPGFAEAYVVDIPPQQISDDVVRLRVTEGRIRERTIQGARYFSEGKILEARHSPTFGAHVQ